MTTFEIGILNVHEGRDRATAAKAVAEIMARHELDAMLLQESGPYLDRLATLPGVRLAAFDRTCGTSILVREGLEVSHVVVLPIGPRWRFRGHWKPRRAVCAAVLDNRLRVVTYHGPAVVQNPINRAAQRLGLRRLVRWLNRRPALPLLMGGDWNDGIGSPVVEQFAHEVGGTLHPGHRIDFAMSRRCEISNVRVLEEGGSDHRLVLLTATTHHQKGTSS